MAYALGLPDALRRRGLRVEVVPGWETRSAGSFNPKGAVAHWTAGPRNATGRPSLSVVTYGRGLQYPKNDPRRLDGPLCNVYGGRDGTAVVVAAGRANHAGTGSWRGLIGNSAVFGTEMEGADAADFTPAQRWSYPHIHAAYCDLGGFGPEMTCGHSEWAGPRKQDINGYTPTDLRRDIAAVLAGTASGGTLMALSDPEQQELLDRLRGVSAAIDWWLVPDDDPGTPFDERQPNSKGELTKRIRGAHTLVAALAARNPSAEVDAAAIAAAIPENLARQVADELVKRLAD